MYNQFQQRLARLGFTSTPISEREYDMLLASGYDEDVIEDIASDMASGWSLREACEAYD